MSFKTYRKSATLKNQTTPILSGSRMMRAAVSLLTIAVTGVGKR